MNMGNRGNSVVELSLIMPVILGVLVMVIGLFLDTVEDGIAQKDGYSILYTYQKDTDSQDIWQKNGDQSAECVSVQNQNYYYERNNHVFITEVDACSKRLKRWQLL